jgi:hypothetical protein
MVKIIAVQTLAALAGGDGARYGSNGHTTLLRNAGWLFHPAPALFS